MSRRNDHEEPIALYGEEHYVLKNVKGKVKNPALEKAENWVAFHEQFTSWEDICRHNTFFNETEKNLTLSNDTSHDPQDYTFYKPKEGVPFWIEAVPITEGS